MSYVMLVLEAPTCIFFQWEGNNIPLGKIEGPQPYRSWCQDWSVLPIVPKRIIKTSPATISKRYLQLVDPKIVNPELKLPEIIEEGVHGHFSGGNFEWSNQFLEASYRGLYKVIEEYTSPIVEEIPFEVRVLGKISGKDPGSLQFSPEVRVPFSNMDIQLIDRLIFPAPKLPECPCRIQGSDLFTLLRAYIKDHINPKYATITRDYVGSHSGLEFKVNKRIQLTEPIYETYTHKKSPRSKKYITTAKTRVEREYVVFYVKEATSPDYPPSLEASSWEELKDKVKKYLEEVTSRINEPLVDCPHCQGKGVVWEDKKKENANEGKEPLL